MKYVFLHGLGQTSHSWQPVLSRLKPQIQATCPDLFWGVKDGNVSYDALYSSLETTVPTYKSLSVYAVSPSAECLLCNIR